MTLPFDKNQLNITNESIQFHHPIDFNLPNDISRIFNNMEQITNLISTYVIILNDDKTFNRTENLDFLRPNSRRTFITESTAKGWAFKSENMETYNWDIRKVCNEIEEFSQLPVNCHLFWGQQDHGSFGWHEDDGNVWAYLVSGKKIMETSFATHELNQGDWIFMPKGLQHKATNLTETVLLSFGNYNFWGDSLVLG